jgi:hypothetical protein
MPARGSSKARSVRRSSRPPGAARKPVAGVYCEVDGLPVEIEPLELSTAGVFVETPTPLPLDSEVEVFVRIGAMRFEASGHVVQTVSCEQAKVKRRKPGYGLLFTNVEDCARAELQLGIQSLAGQRSRDTRPQAAAANAEIPAGAPAADARRALPTRAAANDLQAPTQRPPASPAPGAKAHIDPKERELLEKLRIELHSLDAKTAWGVLGLSQGAELAQAKTAFFEASKRYHPHLYARYAAPEIKQVVTELFIAYKRAYMTMLKSGQTQRASAPAVARSSRQPGTGNK